MFLKFPLHCLCGALAKQCSSLGCDRFKHWHLAYASAPPSLRGWASGAKQPQSYLQGRFELPVACEFKFKAARRCLAFVIEIASIHRPRGGLASAFFRAPNDPDQTKPSHFTSIFIYIHMFVPWIWGSASIVATAVIFVGKLRSRP